MAVSLDSALQEQLHEKLREENAALLAKLEQLEHRKNEEMQNLKTSLIAEQQVGHSIFPRDHGKANIIAAAVCS